MEGFHGFEGDAGEGAAIASLIVVVVQYAHLATVGQVGLHLAADGRFSVDDLQVLRMGLLASVGGDCGLGLDGFWFWLVERCVSG